MAIAKKQIAIKQATKPFLEQTGGVGKGRTFELSRDILSLGRTEDNEIVIKSESVSRCHAYFKRNAAGSWMVQDNKSKNGIKVNGKKILESNLQPGDVITIGDFIFSFQVPQDPDATRPHYELGIPSRLQTLVTLFERHAWVFGVGVGVAIGAGVWIKASRVATRPSGQIVQSPQTKLSKPGPMTTPVLAPEENSVTKADMEVSSKAKNKPKNELRDLKVYLKEGQEYLRENDKESAAVAFRFALVLDPGNREAIRGLKAAGVKAPKAPEVRVEPKVVKPSPEASNRAKVASLLKAAVDSFGRRSYQEAIDKAESARKIELPGSTQYLNEAKQIIDRARLKQKEDFEPFLAAALTKLKERDFKASSLLCEEMLRIDPAYAPAKDCLAKSAEGLAGKGGK